MDKAVPMNRANINVPNFSFETSRFSSSGLNDVYITFTRSLNLESWEEKLSIEEYLSTPVYSTGLWTSSRLIFSPLA